MVNALPIIAANSPFQVIKYRSFFQSISPGFVETEIVEVNGFLQNETMREIVKMAPRMYPIDIALAVAYVLSTPPHFDVRII